MPVTHGGMKSNGPRAQLAPGLDGLKKKEVGWKGIVDNCKGKDMKALCPFRPGKRRFRLTNFLGRKFNRGPGAEPNRGVRCGLRSGRIR